VLPRDRDPERVGFERAVIALEGVGNSAGICAGKDG